MNTTPPTTAMKLQSADALTTAYEAIQPQATSLSVITDEPAIRARVNDLQARLAVLGITDVSQQGRLVLGASVVIGQGLRTGVAMQAEPALSATLDIDTLPSLLDYTRPIGRAGMPRQQSGLPSEGSPRSGRAATQRGVMDPTTVARGGAGLAPSTSLRAATAQAAPATQAAPRRALAMRSSSVIAADEAIIVAEHLQLQDGTQLVIAEGIKYLTIIAQNLRVGHGVSVSWEAAAAVDRGAAGRGSNGTSFPPYSTSASSKLHSPSGGNGQNGEDGDPGYPGDDAPTVEIWALQAASLPDFELQGGSGGTGQAGGRGGDGGDGAKGRESHSMVYGCDKAVGFGGNGGNGGDGGEAGNGGPGGSGGDVRLYLTDASHEAALAAGFRLNQAGGDGGDPGEPGLGGDRGVGGEAGDPTGFWCHAKPERAGTSGSAGAKGDEGKDGTDGETGTLTAVVITEDEFRIKWTAPQVRTVEPSEAAVGDTVTVRGANFTRTARVHFAGNPGSTTVSGDTLLQAVVPSLQSGWVQVVVEIPGGQASNPGSLKVVPTIATVTPNPAALGSAITIFGGGFRSGCHVLFRGLELDPTSIASDGSSVTVTLPAPSGPFEDKGGTEPVAVRNPDGIATSSLNLVLRHVVSTGFNVATNGFSFLNAAPLSGLADMSTFEDTYGTAEVVKEFLLEPVLTGAWYLYYRSFFNKTKPGYSSGFSTTAADEYWSGNPNLFTDFSILSQVERRLTVAQGHVLSLEILSRLALQAAAGVGRAETSLQEIEATFRDMIDMPADLRRDAAPIVQLMPAGTITTKGFITKLGVSHGLLPIRVEYPVSGETWEKRIAVYDNAGTVGVDAFLTFTRDSSGLLRFVLSGDTMNRDTAHGWTLSQASLQVNLLIDVTMPTDYLFMLSPATVAVADAQGRRFGVLGSQVWGDLPGAAAAIGAPGLYLLPLDGDLSVTVSGTGAGTYTLGIVAGSLGRSVTLVDVPVTPATTDVVRIADGLRTVEVTTGDAAPKSLALHYGVAGVRQARALAVEGGRLGKSAPIHLHVESDLSGFDLQGDGPGGSVAVTLTGADAKAVRKHRFDQVAVKSGVPTAFSIASWADLGSDSLKTKA